MLKKEYGLYFLFKYNEEQIKKRLFYDILFEL